jgi:hypothetical protein
MKKHIFLLSGIFFGLSGFSQTTITSIRNIFQTKCVNCHSPANLQGNLDLSGSTQDLISQLVNISATNPTAAATPGEKRLTPGYPERSYLLRLLNSNGWETYSQYNLKTGEDPSNHSSLVTLEKEEIELIRQWVYFNCEPSSTVVNPQTLYNYYHVNGLPRISPPPAPDPANGFQIKLGPIFLTPGQELEYYKKHNLLTTEPLEIKKIDCKINTYSHHYLLFKFEPGTEGEMAEGLRIVNLSSVFPSQTNYLVTFTRSDSLNLPPGTAYRWGSNTVLDLNYHIINYNSDSIFAAESFVNIYKQPYGTATKEMFSRLVVPTRNQAARTLFIPYSSDTLTFAEPDYNNTQDTINIWMLTSHTHSRGTDFDIYKRMLGGAKGEKIYEGYYNESYQYNQGFYSWSHPPIRYFDPLLPLKAKEGVIFEGKFCNYGPHGVSPFVNFSLQTTGEMFIYFVQYTVGGYLWGVGMEEEKYKGQIKVYPNPANQRLFVSFPRPIEKSPISVYDISGRMIDLSVEAKSGTEMVISLKDIPAGIYVLKIGELAYRFVKE